MRYFATGAAELTEADKVREERAYYFEAIFMLGTLWFFYGRKK